MNVNIKRLNSNVLLPEYQTNGAVGFDFASAEKIIIPPKDIILIPTGLIIKVPQDYFLLITARSSLARKKGLMLANGVGTIDQDYCGPDDQIFIMVYNFTDKEVTVEKNDRIANGIFVKIEKAEWNEINVINESTRGGFGSTG